MEHDGPVTPHRLIAARVRELRRRRGWSADRLAQEMTAVGVPWERMVVTKLETGRRQAVTAEELLALAVVLDVSPMTLVMPAERGTVQVTPEVRATWDAAWRWATGDQPLAREGEPPLTLDDCPRLRRHVEVNRPYEASPVKEISWFLLRRFGRQPWSVDLRHDGNGGVTGSVRFHSEAGDGEPQPVICLPFRREALINAERAA